MRILPHVPAHATVVPIAIAVRPVRGSRPGTSATLRRVALREGPGAAVRRAWTAMRRTGVACVFGVLLAAVVGCGGGSDAPPVAPTVSIAGGAAITVPSGTSVLLSVRATDRQGRAVANPALNWSSSDASVATVTVNGSVVGLRVGTSTVSASYDGASASVQVSVTPGVPTQLAVRTQPAGASNGLPLAVQPAVEVRDAAGNLVTGATLSVSASVQGTGAVVSGGTTVSAVAGVATFVSLGVDGVIGERVLQFTATGLAPVTSTPFTVQAGPAVELVLRTQPDGATVGAPLTSQPVVELRDAFGNLSTTATTVVTAALSTGSGTLSGTRAVSAVNGVVTYRDLVLTGTTGPQTIVFTAPGFARGVLSALFVLRAGVPRTLAFRVPPAGAGLNQPFDEQPVVELRDASGNIALGSNDAVVASITAGGGTVAGATATALNGVATFVGLGIDGTPGPRTLAFTSGTLPPLTVAVQPCDAKRAPQIALSAASRTLTGLVSGPAVVSTVNVTETTGSCIPVQGLQALVAGTVEGPWLTATLTSSQRVLELRALPSTLVAGTYQTTVTVRSSNAGTVNLPVSLVLQPSFPISYGDSTQKVLQFDPFDARRPLTIVRDNSGTVVAQPVRYVSRSPALTSVSADGTITARAEGQAWIVATVNAAGGLSDSVFVNTTRGTGPVLRTDLTRLTFDRNATFTVTVQLDTRGATIGAAQAIFTWPSVSDTPGMLRLTNVLPGTVGSPVITTDLNTGTTRFTIVNPSGMSGVITLARFTFNADLAGSSQFTTRMIELIALDQSSLLGASSALAYPVVVR